eukprot:GHVS01054748.1.p1 GENE.GHVS01054748.1~~GHVS01054748.1.p1  ORF type:complete len:124 (+),score=9.90 GHVS01054748.1:855-1226(+)
MSDPNKEVETKPEEEEEVFCKELLMFTDGQIPTMYTAGRQKPACTQHMVCAVTGAPAKYRDPLTGQYYSTREAFKMLRQWYMDQMDFKMRNQLAHLDQLILQKARITRQMLLRPVANLPPEEL